MLCYVMLCYIICYNTIFLFPGKGSLIEVTSPNRRVIVAEGNTAELVWNFETPREISQLNKTFHLCLTTSSGKALLKTVPGQTLTLPMKRVFRNIKISLTEKGKKNYEFKIKLTDVKVVDGGDFKLNIGAGLSLFKKDMSIKLIGKYSLSFLCSGFKKVHSCSTVHSCSVLPHVIHALF